MSFNFIKYRQKYLKYMKKYTNLQIGGTDPYSDDVIEKIITMQKDNINTANNEIMSNTKSLINLDLLKILNITHNFASGQYGKVYYLSPKYVLKKVEIIQGNKNKEKEILKEIRTGYFVEKLNETCDLFSGNVGHFKDNEYYYIIMKKYNTLDTLQEAVGDNTIIDIAISFICQLFLTVLVLSSNGINHGDEKFDNLLFEKIDSAEDFKYRIKGTTYHVKNCGFKLKLIDWGEAGNVQDPRPSWDAAWIENFNLGSKGTKKDINNKGAPNTDYLIEVSKILKMLRLLLDFNQFKTYYENNLNRMFTDDEYKRKQDELYKYFVLIGDSENKESLFREITSESVVIPNIHSILKTFYDSKDYNFLTNNKYKKNEYITSINEFNYWNFPRISFTNDPSSNTINWKYCETRKAIKTAKFEDFIEDITKYNSRSSIDNIIFEDGENIKKACSSTNTNTGNLMSGYSQYYILKNVKIYEDDKIKNIIENGFNTKITYSKPTSDYKIVGDGKYIYIIKSNGNDVHIYIYKINKNDVELFNYGGICLSENESLKNIFKNILKYANLDDNGIKISPLGFFHYHLNYNELLNMFFGIVHAKIEITTELGYGYTDKAYLNKKIKKIGESDKLDLSGDEQKLIMEHSYMFSIDSENNFKLYKGNCKHSLLYESYALNDNFFNTQKFADINYYEDINGKKFIYINKTAANEKYTNDYKKYNSCEIKNYEPTQKEMDDIIKKGLSKSKENYIKLRNANPKYGKISHGDAIDVLIKGIDTSRYISARDIVSDHNMAIDFS